MKNNRTLFMMMAVAAILHIAGTGCNTRASCTNCEGCSTITTRLTSNGSVVYDTTLCSTAYSSRAFQDTIIAIVERQSAASSVTVARRDTSYNCQYANPRGKDVAALESQGWQCELAK